MTDKEYKTIPLTLLRTIISARMSEAKQTIPHYRLTVDIEMDALSAFQKKFNGENPTTKLSVNDCVIKACAHALMENSTINCQLVDGEIRQYHQADISVVVSVEGGLATPVIRNADRKSVQEIAAEVKALAVKARAGQLKMDEIQGGSFSISNLGMYGVDQFDAIINPPQCAILAVARARQKAVVKNNEVTIRALMRVQLSLDHRVIDGAQGAKFLSKLKQRLQHPKTLLM